MHGGGGSARSMRQRTGMDGIADRNGFIAVYPEGTAALLGDLRTWNAGKCCGTAVKKNIDDVGFISALIDKIVKKYGVDARRIYATGHSNGAQMSYRLACELSDKIAAIAPNAGEELIDGCHPVRPVPVIHIHGTADPCALYDGGQACGGCFSRFLHVNLPGAKWPCRAVRDVVAEHARLNGCGTKTKTVFTKGAVTCEKYEGCPADADVELCTIKGAGHIWAGANDEGPAICKSHPDRRICKGRSGVTGQQNHDIDASAFMWNYLKNYSIQK
jgi:polyhydroxybutyrate depolymerase